MDLDTAQAWLDRYVEAWKSYERDAIGELFAEEVAYRYHPYDEPLVGREAVVGSWLGENDADGASTRDAPRTYDAQYAPYAPYAVDGDGRCTEFTEFYLPRPR